MTVISVTSHSWSTLTGTVHTENRKILHWTRSCIYTLLGTQIAHQLRMKLLKSLLSISSHGVCLHDCCAINVRGVFAGRAFRVFALALEGLGRLKLDIIFVKQKYVCVCGLEE